MEVNKVILKLGISMLKTHNQDIKVIDDYEDYLRGEIEEDYYLSFITKGKCYRYMYDFEKFITLLCKEENNKELFIKNIKIIKEMFNNDEGTELIINSLMDDNTDYLIECVNNNEIKLIHVINFLCKDININTLFKRSYSE
ncbi:MAG: hypothetical protein ACRC2K_08020, partial [Clostridium sp.]